MSLLIMRNYLNKKSGHHNQARKVKNYSVVEVLCVRGHDQGEHSDHLQNGARKEGSQKRSF